MKKFVLVSAALLAVTAAAPAQAADLPVKAPPIAVSYAWTGLYIGANLGYSWGRASISNAATSTSVNLNGVLGGVQIGYNWQLDPKWVVGLEADIQATGEKGGFNGGTTSTNALSTPGVGFNTVTTTTTSGEAKLPWFATFRGRAGVLIDPTLLAYVTGGLAVGNVKVATTSSTTVQVFRTAGPDLISTTTSAGAAFSESNTRAGWALGAGAEKKINRNLSAKVEYLYLDLGTRTFFGGTTNATSVRTRDHIVRGGLNWAFN